MGENHPDFATTLKIIGLLYNDEGEYEKAIEDFSKALEIERSSSENTIQTALILSGSLESYTAQQVIMKKQLAVFNKFCRYKRPS